MKDPEAVSPPVVFGVCVCNFKPIRFRGRQEEVPSNGTAPLIKLQSGVLAAVVGSAHQSSVEPLQTQGPISPNCPKTTVVPGYGLR